MKIIVGIWNKKTMMTNTYTTQIFTYFEYNCKIDISFDLILITVHPLCVLIVQLYQYVHV